MSCIAFSVRFSLPCLSSAVVLPYVPVLHPPRAACEPANLRIPVVCCLLSCLLFCLLAFVFSSSTSIPSLLFYFDLKVVLFHHDFSCGYEYHGVSSVSVATRSAYDMHLIRTYADRTFFSFFCLRYIRLRFDCAYCCTYNTIFDRIRTFST